MPRVGFEPTISAGERPKTYALDRAATGTGIPAYIRTVNFQKVWLRPHRIPTLHELTPVNKPGPINVKCSWTLRGFFLFGFKINTPFKS